MTNKHLAKAKDYIDVAESGDPRRQAYKHAADEIEAALDEGITQQKAAAYLGRKQAWVARVLKWAASYSDPNNPATPFAEPRGETREASTATKVLGRSTPEQIKQVLADLPPEQIEAVQTVAQDVAWEQSDAAEAERSGLTPTGVRKQREASQQTGRRRLGVLDALIGLDKARGGLEAAVEALTEATPSEEEWGKFDWRLGQIEQAVEVVRATRTRTGDWDAALAELQS